MAGLVAMVTEGYFEGGPTVHRVSAPDVVQPLDLVHLGRGGGEKLVMVVRHKYCIIRLMHVPVPST